MKKKVLKPVLPTRKRSSISLLPSQRQKAAPIVGLGDYDFIGFPDVSVLCPEIILCESSSTIGVNSVFSPQKAGTYQISYRVDQHGSTRGAAGQLDTVHAGETARAGDAGGRGVCLKLD